jgi:hypothetical protein
MEEAGTSILFICRYFLEALDTDIAMGAVQRSHGWREIEREPVRHRTEGLVASHIACGARRSRPHVLARTAKSIMLPAEERQGFVFYRTISRNDDPPAALTSGIRVTPAHQAYRVACRPDCVLLSDFAYGLR